MVNVVSRNREQLLENVNPDDLSKAFGEAASDIKQYGWRRKGADFNEYDTAGEYSRCIWIGVTRSLERMFEPIDALTLYMIAAENALLVHFNLARMLDLFILNDGFEGSNEEGKLWAVENLQAIQTALQNGAR